MAIHLKRATVNGQNTKTHPDQSCNFITQPLSNAHQRGPAAEPKVYVIATFHFKYMRTNSPSFMHNNAENILARTHLLDKFA